jgi:hypothetical protein
MLREIPTRCWLGLASGNPFVGADRNCITTFARNESTGNMRTVISENHFRWADPTKWPWVVYFWLAAITVGYAKPVWRWLERNRAKDWPIAEGRFESADVDEKKWFSPSVSFRSRSAKHIAKLGYSYSVAGTTYSGTHKREFEVEGEAWEFVRELKGRVVTVQYNPKKPSVSILLEQSIETLQQTRPPVPFTDSTPFAGMDSVPPFLKPFLWLFVGLSAVGLFTSLYVHLGAVMGRRVAPESFFWILHMGIFVVWFPTVLVANRRVGSARRKDYWKLALRGSPEWMRYMVYGFFGYAIVNFGLFMLKAPTGSTGSNPPTEVWRGFSGHWMAFYSAALATLYSAVNENTYALRCLNGHPIPPGANYCERCGQPVVHVR